MSDHEPKLAEGLLEYLQVVGGGWSAKLTMERLGFVKIIAKLATERDEALKHIDAEQVQAVKDATEQIETIRENMRHKAEIERLQWECEDLEHERRDAKEARNGN